MMTTSRTLLTALALLAVLAAVGTAFAAPADQEAAEAGSGGTLAEPVVESRGGGTVAPPAAERAEAAEAGEEADPPRAEAGQEEQQLTPPEAEDQSGVDAQAGEPAATPVQDFAAEELAGPVADTGGGDLPSTGLELSAMAIIGLGLLLLGAALRPRRSVPARRR
jgi:LPXTG-motif cell wall-anchored protein